MEANWYFKCTIEYTSITFLHWTLYRGKYTGLKCFRDVCICYFTESYFSNISDVLVLGIFYSTRCNFFRDIYNSWWKFLQLYRSLITSSLQRRFLWIYLFITQCSKILLILYWSNVYLNCKVSTWTNDECTCCWKILISVQISVYSVSFTKLLNKISFYHQQLVKNNFPRRLIKNSRPKEPTSFKILKFM